MDKLRIMGFNLYYLRVEAGYTKKRMAGIIGICEKTLARLERGELPPRFNVTQLVRVSKHFGVTVDGLFIPREGREYPPKA